MDRLMQPLRNGDLTIEVAAADAPARIELTWRGKSNDRYPGKVLSPFFQEVLAAASREARLLDLRFDSLEHFNSSTVGALIELIQRAREVQVRLVIGYDATVGWQRLSFDALKVFDRGDGLFELRPRGELGGAR
jgi:hypothetical protein